MTRRTAPLLLLATLSLPVSAQQKPAQPPSNSVLGQAGSSIRACTDCPEVIWLPQGSYMRGSPASEKRREMDEGPVRKVTMDYPLAAGKYPVTFAQWDACVRERACPMVSDEGWGRKNRPVINVSYNAITQKYLPWLNHKALAAGLLPSGYRFALPTESEREYFARGITEASEVPPPFPSLPGTRWANGRCPHTDAFNYDGHSDYANCGARTGISRDKTLPVDQLPYTNRFGLFGVTGNVAEWTRDCYYDDYAHTPDNGQAAKETSGCAKVIRGGSWDLGPENLRAAQRSSGFPTDRSDVLGFRVVLTPRK